MDRYVRKSSLTQHSIDKAVELTVAKSTPTEIVNLKIYCPKLLRRVVLRSKEISRNYPRLDEAGQLNSMRQLDRGCKNFLCDYDGERVANKC